MLFATSSMRNPLQTPAMRYRILFVGATPDTFPRYRTLNP
jgi:hypothetical protein